MKGVEVTDEMMDAVSGMQLVESVTLLPGNNSNGFTYAPGRRFWLVPARVLTLPAATAGTSTCTWTTRAR